MGEVPALHFQWIGFESPLLALIFVLCKMRVIKLYRVTVRLDKASRGIHPSWLIQC